MADLAEYRNLMSEALNARGDWLEKTRLPKLKDEFRTFHTAFYSLYVLFLKRKLIREDAYKQEAKIVDIEVPDTGAFNEGERLDQLSLRLSHFDNQLDFLVNFYQFSLEYMGLDKIKRILGLVKYVDWVRFSPDSSATPNTKAMVDLVSQVKSGADQVSATVIMDALFNLNKSSGAIMGHLKEVSNFNREAYKLELRNSVTASMSPQEAVQIAHVKKKFTAALPGKPFYPELAEEVVREDYSRDGPAMRDKILKQFAIPAAKPVAKAQVSYKTILIEGLYAIGTVTGTLEEILPKFEDNHSILEDQKKSFWKKVKFVLQQMMNKEPEPVIYEVEYVESGRNTPVREKINYIQFRSDLERKIKNLANLNARGGVAAKLEAMEEAQLMGLLERYIRDIQTIHKLLIALDDFFKAVGSKVERGKIKGIKPELATIKNVIVKANQRRYEFSAQKEEAEQFKKLGIISDA